MSAPISRWAFMTLAGLKKCFEPSSMLLNSTPSGVILRKSFRLHTWNPPLSVKTGPSHAMNLWMPPAFAMRGVVGRRYRWYVFASMISALMSLSWAGVTALTVASVPTGIKMGVVTSPWSVCTTPRRAFDFLDVFRSSKRFIVPKGRKMMRRLFVHNKRNRRA